MTTKSRPLPAAIERELAESLGFTAELDHARGSTWCKFKKDNWYVWSLGYSWAVAELIDGRYKNRRYTFKLEPCLRFVNDVISGKDIEAASLTHAMRLKPIRTAEIFREKGGV